MGLYDEDPITWDEDTKVTPAVMNKEIRDKFNEIASAVYPVGSIYVTTNPTNPATIFGFGTWEAFGAGKTLVGLNAVEAEFDTVEKTGGEKTHVLSAAENGPHNHGYTRTNIASSGEYGEGGGTTNGNTQSSVSTSSSGSGTPHNNLQPYIVVYFWKRAA